MTENMVWKKGQGILEFILIFVFVTGALLFTGAKLLNPTAQKMYADAGSALSASGDLFANIIGNLENTTEILDEENYGEAGGYAGVSGSSSGSSRGSGSGSGGGGSSGSSGGGFGGGGASGESGGSSGGSSSGGSSSGGGITGGGSSGGGTGVVYDSNLTTVLAVLKGSSAGGSLGNLIEQMSISLSYGSMPDGALAYWDSGNNAIVVNSFLRTTFSEKAIAGIVGHEATHADYSYNPQKWIDLTLERHPELTSDQLHIIRYPFDSIDQEYNAFAATAQVWQEVRGSETNASLDSILSSYSQGESFFKNQIRTAYADQPSVKDQNGNIVEY